MARISWEDGSVDANFDPGTGANASVIAVAPQPDGKVLGGGSWSDSSDERLKTNIEPLDSSQALDKITQLRGVTFEWIHAEEHGKGLKAGILAQELEVIFPDWVEEVEPTGKDEGLIPQGDKAKAIWFPHDFNAYLIEAIKELKAQNERQQTEIEELRALIKELKS